VYGDSTKPIHAWLSIGQSTMATIGVIAAMIGIAAGWQAWRARRRSRTPAVVATGSTIAAS
jgi:O-antigen ligase